MYRLESHHKGLPKYSVVPCCICYCCRGDPCGRPDQYSIGIYCFVVGVTLVVAFGMPQGYPLLKLLMLTIILKNKKPIKSTSI
jgi:hypothetical protein